MLFTLYTYTVYIYTILTPFFEGSFYGMYLINILISCIVCYGTFKIKHGWPWFISHIYIYMYIYMPNKNTWGVKKVRGQEEPATKSSDIT